jgi:hypothetical protein
MGIFEWIILAVFILAAYKQYKKQEYWLDRQVAKLPHVIKNTLVKLIHSIKKGA